MSKTDVLRKLLDERGEDYSTAPDGFTTWWHDAGEITAWEDSDGVLTVWGITPEQAVNATLGNSRADYHGYEQAAIEAWESVKAWNSRAERMCEMRADGAHCMNGVEFYECRSCGEYACIPTMMGKSEPPNYCPNCGARVVE